jgi:hypothetical protein
VGFFYCAIFSGTDLLVDIVWQKLQMFTLMFTIIYHLCTPVHYCLAKKIAREYSQPQVNHQKKTCQTISRLGCIAE